MTTAEKIKAYQDSVHEQVAAFRAWQAAVKRTEAAYLAIKAESVQGDDLEALCTAARSLCDGICT